MSECGAAVDRFFFHLSSLECSGHGLCVDGTCVCFDGFSGSSHFISFEGLDCHINTRVEQGLWVWFLLMISIGAVKSVPAFFVHFQRFRRVNGLRFLRKKRERQLRDQLQLVALAWLNFVLVPSAITLGVNQVVNPGTQHIGIDALPTIAFLLLETSLISLGLLYAARIPAKWIRGGFDRGFDPKLDSIASRTIRIGRTVLLLRLSSVFVASSSVFSSRKGSIAAFIVYCAVFALFAPFAEILLLKSLTEAGEFLDKAFAKTQSDPIKKLRDNTITSAKVNLGLILFAAVGLFMLALPWFWGYFDFFYPLVMGPGIGTYALGVVSHLPERSGIDDVVEIAGDALNPPTNPSSIPSSTAVLVTSPEKMKI